MEGDIIYVRNWKLSEKIMFFFFKLGVRIIFGNIYIFAFRGQKSVSVKYWGAYYVYTESYGTIEMTEGFDTYATPCRSVPTRALFLGFHCLSGGDPAKTSVRQCPVYADHFEIG